MQLSSPFRRVTFRTKIVTGFIACLTVIVVTVVVSVGTAQRVLKNTGAFVQSVGDAQAASDLRQSMSSLRRVVQIYLASPSHDTLATLRSHQERLTYHARLVEDIAASEEITKSPGALQDLIEMHGAELEQVIALTRLREDLVYRRLAELDTEIDAYLDRIAVPVSLAGTREDLVAANYVSGVKQSLDAARLGVQTFLDKGNAQSVAVVQEDLDKAIEHLWTLLAVEEREAERTAGQSVIELIPVYHQTIKRIVAASTARAKILNGPLEARANEILKRVRLLADFANIRNESIRLSTTLTTERSLVLVLIVGVFGLLVGVAFATSLSTGLVRSLDGVTNSMIRLAKGDMSAEVPATERSDEVGELARAFHVFRKNAHSLVESEQRFRRIFEHAAEGICRSTVDGRFLEVNKSMAKMLGCQTPEAFLAHYGHDIAGTLYVEPRVRSEVMDELLRTGVVIGKEVRVRRKDGNLIWIALSSRVLHDETENTRVLESFVHDITERKLAEEALSESERRFKLLFENAEVSIWNEDLSQVCESLDALRDEGVTDLRQYLDENRDVAWDLVSQVKVIQVNEGTLKLFGARTEKEMLGKISQTFGEETMSVFIEELCAIWDKKEVFRSEAKYRTLDGRNLTAIITYRIPETRDGFKNVPVSIIDITERKVLEDQLRRVQRMEAVGQLTGGVAHDFNNLLGVLLGNAELLKENLIGDPDVQKQVEAIIRSAERGASLTNRLLAFSRQQALAPRSADVAELLAGLEEMLDRTLGEQVDLRLVAGADLWPAMIDPHQFENALINLVLNARDAMPQGGTLSIESANVTLDHDFASRNEEVQPGDYVLVAVRDSGSGMNRAVLEKVFEPFFTTKEVGKGSGLGLSMVYGFAKQSRGHIAIDSEAGTGTTVKLYLPRSTGSLQQEPVPQTGDAAARAQAPNASGRILVVEDDPGVREIPVKILRDLGYDVSEATDGREAVACLRAGKPFDLLFTDVILPGGMNGMEIAQEARRLQPGIKVIYTTGYAEDVLSGDRSLERDAELVSKPYRRADLLQRVRGALDPGRREDPVARA